MMDIIKIVTGLVKQVSIEKLPRNLHQLYTLKLFWGSGRRDCRKFKRRPDHILLDKFAYLAKHKRQKKFWNNANTTESR